MKYSLLFISTLIISICFGQINEVDSQGRKQGEWAKLYEGTRVFQYKGQFKNNKPVGKFVYYYKSSKVKAVINHEEGSTRSLAYYYHENGAMMSHGIFRNQLKDSVWINFGPSQRLSNTETYSNGKLNGKKVVYYVPEDVHDKNQIPSGVYLYKNDMLDGKFTEYFNDLTVKGTGQYVNNKKEGIWESYQANGKKMTLTRYKNGHRHGWCLGYDEYGKEAGRQYYYMGELIEGERLKERMAHMKSKGINPND